MPCSDCAIQSCCLNLFYNWSSFNHYYKPGICSGVAVLMGRKRLSFSSEYFCIQRPLLNLSTMSQINSVYEPPRKMRSNLENKWLVHQAIPLSSLQIGMFSSCCPTSVKLRKSQFVGGAGGDVEVFLGLNGKLENKSAMYF